MIARNRMSPHAHTAASRLMKIAAMALVVAFSAIAIGCASAPGDATDSTRSELAEEADLREAEESATPGSAATAVCAPTLEERVAEKLAGMTLEQKVAQLFVVSPESITGVGTVTQAGETTREALQTYPVGGIVYFQKNLVDPEQTKAMIANAQAYAQESAGLPLLVAVDEEGGTVSRIGGNPGFDVPNAGNMADVGATGDPDQARAVAASIGTYLQDLGFNVDFAPVADICGDPAADVMALRSFGGDPQLVASMVQAQVQGFADAGVLCSVKHFPGIGGVRGDSHDGAIASEKTMDELRAKELVPFEAAIAANVPLVMVGHLSTPAATGSNVPASINPAIVGDLLRGELGYKNLVITDSMSMGAVDGFCAPDQVGVAAMQAGADLVLMPADFPAAYQGVLDAVAEGIISEDRVNESVTRIVKAKLALAEA